MSSYFVLIELDKNILPIAKLPATNTLLKDVRRNYHAIRAVSLHNVDESAKILFCKTGVDPLVQKKIEIQTEKIKYHDKIRYVEKYSKLRVRDAVAFILIGFICGTVLALPLWLKF